MYFPIDGHVRLRIPQVEGDSQPAITSVSANRERTLLAVATSNSISIWLAHPQLVLALVSISDEDLHERGELSHIYWRFDSTAIAITTSKQQVLIYRVDISSENCYNLVDSSEANLKRVSQELFLRGDRPTVQLFPAVVVNLADTATCCVPLREELFVCVRNGFCHHISWEGGVSPDLSVRVADIPFSNDQLQSKPEYVSNASVHVVSSVYAPLIGGYCIVLSDGRAALLTSQDSRFRPASLLGVWASSLKDAVCTDVNHKFRLLLFGCSNGDVTAYHLDDANGALIQAFRVGLKIRNGPEVTNRLGAISRLSVLSNGSAFAAIWEGKQTQNATELLKPTLAVFTPFGAQTWCSLESVLQSEEKSGDEFTSLDWGPEGFQLWLGRRDGLSMLRMARSAAVGNPTMEHVPRMTLTDASRVLLAPPREREESASAPHAVWSVLSVPYDYLSSNWPIRFASTDIEAKTLVVAGARGLAHCSIANSRWKIFGNESQERDLVATGGVFVWNGTAGVACYDADSGKEQIRFYSLATKLDNRYGAFHTCESRVMMLCLRQNVLVTFDMEGRIILHVMRRTDSGGPTDVVKVSVQRVAEVRVEHLITHPTCLVSMQLTQLTMDPGGLKFVSGIDTVLVNVSGRLITLNPRNSNKDDEEAEDRFQLNQPIMVASFVEQIWHDRAICDESHLDSEKPHLSNALWINCGSKGMRVWLPLLPGKKGAGSQDTSFISKRIMLPFELDIIPCSVYSGDCLAMGVESVPYSLSLSQNRQSTIYNVHRNSEVFVHHLLRQLLKRNLGVFALEVAASVRSLPHFTHSLELLMHSVLEEEATCSEPIPDPLLPRCVAFVQEFPEFVRTVAHCARKTEIALWGALFAVTGSPHDLFEASLRDGQLQTAASYLIVLQNVENIHTSVELSCRLLREALSAGEWAIARDIVRFARSIDDHDMNSPARTPPPQRAAGRRPASLSLDSQDASDLVFARFHANKARGRPHTERDGLRKDSAGWQHKVARTLSSDGGPPSPTDSKTMVEKMERILEEHGRRLLDEYCVRDLGFFLSQLDVSSSRVLSRSQIPDFSIALTRIHSQFELHYPVHGKLVVDHLEKRFGSMRLSRSTATLNASSVLDTPMSTLSGKMNGEQVTTVNGSRMEDSVRLNGSGTEESDALNEEVEARLKRVEESQESNRQYSGSNDTSHVCPSSPTGSSVVPSDFETNTKSCTTPDWQYGVNMLVGDVLGGCGKTQTQISHMVNLFSQASAVDWIVLLCLVSRDMTRLRQEVTSSTVERFGIEQFGMCRRKLYDLRSWAEHNCVAYVSLMAVFTAHLDMVSEQAGCPQLPPAAVDNEVKREPAGQNGTLPSKKDRGFETGQMRSAALRDAFGGRRRERSRSVDRTERKRDDEGCSVM